MRRIKIHTPRDILMVQVMFHKHLNIPKYHGLRLIRGTVLNIREQSVTMFVCSLLSVFCDSAVRCCKQPINSNKNPKLIQSSVTILLMRWWHSGANTNFWISDEQQTLCCALHQFVKSLSTTLVSHFCFITILYTFFSNKPFSWVLGDKCYTWTVL